MENDFAWRMLLNIGSRCRVSPQNDFLNVLATHMIEQMTLNTESNCKVSLQCELSYVSVNLQLGKMTLNTVCRCVVFHPAPLVEGRVQECSRSAYQLTYLPLLFSGVLCVHQTQGN